jgi:hypothetical protein
MQAQSDRFQCDDSCDPDASGVAKFNVVSPVGFSTVKPIEMAPRLTTLDGKTIAIVGEDFMYNITHPELKRLIKEHYPKAKVIMYDERLWLYTAEQHIEGDLPRVRFTRSDVVWQMGAFVDGPLILKGDEYADPMKGWALVRVVGDQCSPQAIVTRCTLYQQYMTEEALQTAAKSYGGLTNAPYLSPR